MNKRFRESLERGIEIAAAGENIVVMGIQPTRAETGYGYIEAGAAFEASFCASALYRKAGCRTRPQSSLAAGNYLLE